MKLRPALLVSLVTAVSGGFILLLELSSGWFALEENIGLSWLFHSRGGISPPAEVLIISMDKLSAVKLNHDGRMRDWPRSLHAQLVNKVVELNAAAIVFDVFFGEAKAGEDSIFAEAIANAQRVVLAQEFWRENINIIGISTESLANPAAELAAASLGLAPFPLPKYPNRVNQFWTFQDNKKPIPTLPLLALQVSVQRTLPPQALGVLFEIAGLEKADLNSAEPLQQFMRELHSRLRENPQSLKQILNRLSDETTLSEQSKKTLTALIQAYSSGSRFLNHYGPAKTITALSYSDFLQPAAALPDLQDKVVFIGGRDPFPRQTDRFYTVYSNKDEVDISGVEIAATAFANLLTGTTLRQLNGLNQIMLVLIFGSVAGILAFRFSGMNAVTVIILMAIAYYACSLWLFTHHYLWLPLVTPLLIQLPLALLLGLLLQYRLSQQEMKNINLALLGYVPKNVVKYLRNRNDPLQPDIIYGACLCSDIENYTTLSELLDPRLLTELTNEYYASIGAAIDRYQGTRLDIVGDGMTCVWPSQQPDYNVRLNACLAALAVQKSLSTFHQAHSQYELSTRIGLHAGAMAMGNMGGSGHYIYGIAGDVPNTASRIEGLNKYLGTRILAEQAVVSDLREILVRPMGRFQFKGKNTINTIFEIVNQHHAAPAAERILVQRFSEALALYQAKHWTRAAAAFASLLDDYPDDGPSRFYLTRCQSPPFYGKTVIKMTEK